jgi:hypothetical protein
MRCTTAEEDPCVSGKFQANFVATLHPLRRIVEGHFEVWVSAYSEHLAPLARTDVITGKIASE